MGKGWSLLFGAVMLACFGLFLVAPLVGWWMPEGVSAHAWSIDKLFYIILGITGFFFVLTEALLIVFMWRYAGRPEGVKKTEGLAFFGRFKRWIPDEHKLEMVWTVVPALILLYIAVAQVSAWAEVKYPGNRPQVGAANLPDPVQAEVSARQFEWRIRYPGYETWKKFKTDPQLAKNWAKTRLADDVWVVNELHIIKDRPVLVQVKTLDVIHSFNLPQMRVKQDALPGKTIPVWFTPTKSNTVRGSDRYGQPRWEDGKGWDPVTGKALEPKMVWEIACAELCGWGHGRMIGKVFVHDTAQDFEDWLRHADKEANRRTAEAVR